MAGYIFLDIDGVITHDASGEYFDAKVPGLTHGRRPSRACLERLNVVVAQTGAELILSSHWRYRGNNEQIERVLRDFGLEFPIAGRTMGLGDRDPATGLWGAAGRGDEIRVWLEQEAPEANYVIIDDDEREILASQQDRFVHVKDGLSRGGLLNEHATAAILILQGQQ